MQNTHLYVEHGLRYTFVRTVFETEFEIQYNDRNTSLRVVVSNSASYLELPAFHHLILNPLTGYLQLIVALLSPLKQCCSIDLKQAAIASFQIFPTSSISYPPIQCQITCRAETSLNKMTMLMIKVKGKVVPVNN
jgi:hypothetical protein